MDKKFFDNNAESLSKLVGGMTAVKRLAAASTTSKKDLLDALSEDDDSQVRLSVAKNVATPNSTLTLMSLVENGDIKRSAEETLSRKVEF